MPTTMPTMPTVMPTTTKHPSTRTTEPTEAVTVTPDVWVSRLGEALEGFDEAGGHRILSRVFEEMNIEEALGSVVLPYLQAVGDRWESGEIGVAQEHVASNVVRTRLSVAMQAESEAARGDGAPLAVLACVPGEFHEFGLMATALSLSRLGWRTCYLGANTPMSDVALATAKLQPAAVVLAALRETGFAARARGLRKLAESITVYVGGNGATADVADLCDARRLEGDPVTGARRVHEESGAGDCEPGTRPAAVC